MNNKKFLIAILLLSCLIIIPSFTILASAFNYLISLIIGIFLFCISLGITAVLYENLANDNGNSYEFDNLKSKDLTNEKEKINQISSKKKYLKKVDCQAPSNDPPAFINSLFARRTKINEISIGSFYLTLLDLINRRYISVQIVSKKQDTNRKTLDKIILKINNHSTTKLHPFERNVLRCVSSLKYQGNINLLDTKNAINKRLKVNTFQKNYDAWIKNFYNEISKNRLKLPRNGLKKILGISEWTEKDKELKIKWNLFKNYYTENLKRSNHSNEFLNEGIKYIPYLLALGIPKTTLINSFSQSTNIPDTVLFLKYGKESLIRNIINDFLRADSSFDPKYYNTSGNFVPGYG